MATSKSNPTQISRGKNRRGTKSRVQTDTGKDFLFSINLKKNNYLTLTFNKNKKKELLNIYFLKNF